MLVEIPLLILMNGRLVLRSPISKSLPGDENALLNILLTNKIIAQLIFRNQNNSATNTDGIINGLVMVFANPAPMTDPAKTCTRTPAPARNFNPAP